MTLGENIRIGAQSPVTDEMLTAIAQETGFDSVMKKNGLTFDTVLGEWFRNGTNLSGGEQALLAMTRMAVAGAKFLVFDEPTAGLDQKRTDAVLQRLHSLKDTTRIVISHDYGIASQADRILVLDRGTVAAIGTHAELLENCELYRVAWNRAQHRMTMPDSSN